MVSRSVHTAIALSIAGGAILSAIGFIFARTALEWMQTPDTVIDLAEHISRFILFGMIPNLYYNYMCSNPASCRRFQATTLYFDFLLSCKYCA